MANPFDILPPNLFNLFSTQGYITLQQHYMAILLRIYALAEFNRFGLAREVVIAEIVDYLQTADVEREIAAEMEAQLAGDPDFCYLSAVENHTRITPLTCSGGSKRPAGSSANSTPTTAKPSPCPIMPLPCWKRCAKSRSRSRTSSPANCIPPTNSSPPPRPTRISRRPWQ